MKLKKTLVVAAFGAAVLSSPAFAFTQEQVDKGKSEYNTHCRTCHAANGKGALGPALTGDEHKKKWGGKSSAELADYIQKNMPQTAPGSLKPEQLDVLMAYILQLNGGQPSDKPYTKEEPHP